MSNTITPFSHDDIRAILPNIQRTVDGEAALVNKIEPYVLQAERTIIERFIPEENLISEFRYRPDKPLAMFARRAIIAHAIALSLSALDIFLTPNGLATVGNDKLTPASRDRSNRLIAAINIVANRAEDSMLQEILTGENTQLRNTQQARFFLGTLFPSLAVLDFFAPADAPTNSSGNIGSASLGIPADRFPAYVRLRSRILTVENFLASQFVSPELLCRLRSSLPSELSTLASELKERLRSIVLDSISGEPKPKVRQMAVDAVQFIRTYPDEFPEWGSSSVATLFSPPVFENKKSSAGFFFA